MIIVTKHFETDTNKWIYTVILTNFYGEEDDRSFESEMKYEHCTVFLPKWHTILGTVDDLSQVEVSFY